MNYIDKFLNAITMYKLVFTGLLLLAGCSVVLSLFGINSIDPTHQLASLVVAVISVIASTVLFAWLFKATINYDSAGITGAIVFFLMFPAGDVRGLSIIALTGVIAAASKFIIAPSQRHIFNPAAAAAVIISILGIEQAFWWVGRSELLIPVLILGVMILRKLRRFELFFTFLVTAILSYYFVGFDQAVPLTNVGIDALTVFPTLFLGTVMLTEPITTPPRRYLRLSYAVFVGLLLGSIAKIGPLSITPEWALVIGNAVFWFSMLQKRVTLSLKNKNKVGSDVYEFSFTPSQSFSFMPGQYLEVTAPIVPDIRGNRRSFSIASASHESNIKIGVKIPSRPSAFKKYMQSMQVGDTLHVNHLQGDFLLPKLPEKLVLIAGGIGITPFRSMISHIVESGKPWDIVLFYQAKTKNEFAFTELFDSDDLKKVGIKVVYVVSEEKSPKNWVGETGFINETMLKKHVKDIEERTFYISGPNALVVSYSKLLMKINVRSKNIKQDYFSGY